MKKFVIFFPPFGLSSLFILFIYLFRLYVPLFLLPACCIENPARITALVRPSNPHCCNTPARKLSGFTAVRVYFSLRSPFNVHALRWVVLLLYFRHASPCGLEVGNRKQSGRANMGVWGVLYPPFLLAFQELRTQSLAKPNWRWARRRNQAVSHDQFLPPMQLDVILPLYPGELCVPDEF